MGIEPFEIAWHFARARWRGWPADRSALEACQQRELQRFFRDVLPRAPIYRDARVQELAALPLMDKSDLMRDFDARNTRGIRLDEALSVGLQAEATRDFLPMIGDVTVGLSSGTSGNRGVFLVSAAERRRWAGILMARALPEHLMLRLLSPWAPPVRVAFFLRANSNLYETLGSRRVLFAFFDLLAGVRDSLSRLHEIQPDVLVGSPQLLHALAMEVECGRLDIRPSHVISVAEVLEDADAVAVQRAFGVRPHQLYQATEGFLGYTCAKGKLHLNERFVHIEPQWLDASRTCFVPIVTDFTRSTQLIVRYRLNDVLRVAEQPCTCGSPERTLTSIEGRSDEVLWLPSLAEGRAVPVFPDFVRRCMVLAGPQVREFNVVQKGMCWMVNLLAEHPATARERVTQEMAALWAQLGVHPPELVFGDWQGQHLHLKRRRVRMQSLPENMTCTF